jgi:hypothetical protein
MPHRLLVICSLSLLPCAGAQESHDVVVYGGTSSGVAAAVQVARMGKSVVVVEPGRHIGGLTASGLGWTDSGNKSVIGGISREFYQRLKQHYDRPAAWKFGKREDYARYRAGDDAIWAFEPHVAEQTFARLLDEHGIAVHLGERLDRSEGGVSIGATDPPHIVSFKTDSGRTYRGAMFIDATYEGDLMAAAGVSYTVGREANDALGETLNGVQRARNISSHRFVVDVDPYVELGIPDSGLLPGIDTGPQPEDGAGDHRVQAYCYRMCMSDVPENRIRFPKPAGYDERWYELLLRNFEAGDLRLPLKPDRMPNGKTDTNNSCAVSTDFIGQNYDYPEASYTERETILAAHRTYQQGLMWTLANHPRVPESIREKMSRWGLARDEFPDNGGWPHQIYVREARRLIGDHVMSELDCRRVLDTPMSVGMGSYNMDSHNCMRYVTPGGFVQNEGDIQVSPGGAYRISYLSIVPRRGEAANLLVPVCISSSHIAYGSIRMEPVFMILGQSAATAAVLAIENDCAVQEVSYEILRERLLADGQVLEHDSPPLPPIRGIELKTLSGLVIDDVDAVPAGEWTESRSVAGFVGKHYLHDGNRNKGAASVRFTVAIEEAGEYEVRLSYTAHPNRASRVPVSIETSEGVRTLQIDQTAPPPLGSWASLGRQALPAGEVVVIVSNEGTDGYVVADSVQFLGPEE